MHDRGTGEAQALAAQRGCAEASGKVPPRTWGSRRGCAESTFTTKINQLVDPGPNHKFWEGGPGTLLGSVRLLKGCPNALWLGGLL